MDCRGARKALMDYVDGNLHDDLAGKVRSHLEDCAGCSVAAERLSLSASALGTLEEAGMSPEARERVSRRLRQGEPRRGTAPGFLRNPRAVAGAGLVTAVLVGVAVIVGIYTAGGPARRTVTDRAARGESAPVSVPAGGGDRGAAELAVPPVGSIVTPLASVTANQYDKDSIESMARDLDIKKEFARSYTLADAVGLRVPFERKLADDFVTAGGDGPMLEAMISYVSASEPVLLPCYAEKAFFTGRPVIIVALSGPPRNGATRNLTRTEFWAFSTETFPSSPDQSVLWWGQSQE